MQPPKGWTQNLPSREIDVLLEFWVHMANVTGTEVGVTVHVGGSMIQGTTISAIQWMTETAESLRDAKTDGDPQVPHTFADELDKLRHRAEERLAQESEERDIEWLLATAEAEEQGEDPNETDLPLRPLNRYLHLRDVDIKQGAAWHWRRHLRVDLRSVDGWTLGTEE